MRSFPILALASMTRLVQSLTPITIKGNGFFAGKDQFFFAGVDYQPGGPVELTQGFDPFSDLDACKRDVYLMQQLGVNAIRTYAVNTTLNHDACMSLLDAAGIYVVLDVNAPGWRYSVNREEPWTSYNHIYMENVFSVIDQFSGYPNLLGFFSGNELANDFPTANTTAIYMRAIQRDMRQYIKSRGLREIPIGYSTADVVEFREDLAHYLDCIGPDGGHADFYGINQYEWCGVSTFEESGYQNLTGMMEKAAMPMFFSEYGCNEVKPRSFSDVPEVYKDRMNHVFSGGVIYEYNAQTNDFGLVKIDQKSGAAQLLPDYETLRQVHAEIKLPTSDTSNDQQRPQCSKTFKEITSFDAERDIPEQPSGVPLMIKSGVKVTRGKFIDVDLSMEKLPYEIKDVSGEVIASPVINKISSGWNPLPTGAGPGGNGGGSSTGGNGSEESENAAVANVKGAAGLAGFAVVGLSMFFMMVGGLLV